jgi:hypothetical protein
VSNGLSRRTIVASLISGFVTELLVILFNLFTSPDPPRWLGTYRVWVWFRQPGYYIADHQSLPGGLLVIFVVQGLIYSVVASVIVGVFRGWHARS